MTDSHTVELLFLVDLPDLVNLDARQGCSRVLAPVVDESVLLDVRPLYVLHVVLLDDLTGQFVLHQLLAFALADDQPLLLVRKTRNCFGLITHLEFYYLLLRQLPQKPN